MIIRLYILIIFAITFTFISCDEKSKSENHIFTNQKINDSIYVYNIIEKGDSILDLDPDLAILEYQRAYEYSKNNEYNKGIGLYYRSVSYAYGNRKNNKNLGLKYANEYITYALENESDEDKGFAYFAKGVVYHSHQVYDSAANYYELAVPYTERYHPKNIPVILNNLGTIYTRFSFENKALKSIKKAYESYKNYNDTLGLISCLINKSNVYDLNEKNITNEIITLKEAEQLANKTTNYYYLAIIHNNLASNYKTMQSLDSALIYIKKSIDYFKLINDDFNTLESKITMAGILSSMGQEQTLIELITVLSKDPNINSIAPEKVKLLEELKMNIFTKQNDFKKAFLSAQKILSLSETFRSKDHTDALIKLDQKLEESEQKKILLKTELDLSKKTQLLGSIFGLFLLTVIVSLIYIKYQNKLNQETIKYSEIKAKSEERDRISKDLHDDLGSSMTSIRLLSEILVESSSEKSAKRIGEIALENIDKLNEIVWFENPQNDYISSLTAYLKNYITSIKSFSNQQINIEINQDIPNVKISGIKRRAIILAFKEAINNALKHSNATLITIDITDQNQNYIITIHDNGIKYNIEDLNRKSGIDIMKKRIESVGGQFEIETQHNKIIKMTIPHIIK